MKRALAVTAAMVALGAVLLTGCRHGATQASGTPGTNPAGNSAVTGVGGSAGTAGGSTTSKGGGGTQTGSVDTQIDSIDGLLGQLDDQNNKANQPPPDKD